MNKNIQTVVDKQNNDPDIWYSRYGGNSKEEKYLQNSIRELYLVLKKEGIIE